MFWLYRKRVYLLVVFSFLISLFDFFFQIPLSDYSPGSEAGSSPNDYFYGSGSQGNSAVNSNSNYHHHSLATSPSSFPFESNESR